jgi:hypothetical protein
MLIDIAIEKVKGLLSFFSKYRETGFAKALESAKEIAFKMGIEPTFPTRRNIKRKMHFDETPEDATIAAQSIEESIRVNYFLLVVDQAITSLIRRFERYKGYENIFGFLFTLNKLRSLYDKRLMSSGSHLETALKSGEDSDIDDKDLHLELKFLQDFIPIERDGPCCYSEVFETNGMFSKCPYCIQNFVNYSCDYCICRAKLFKAEIVKVIFEQHYDTRKT